MAAFVFFIVMPIWKQEGIMGNRAAAVEFFLSEDADFVTGQVPYGRGGLSIGSVAP